MKLKNICFFIDIYSKRATFYYNNHEKISSEFGVFLTIVHIIITLIITIYYLYITIQRKEIKVYNSSIYSQEMPIIEINSDNLYFAFGIEDLFFQIDILMRLYIIHKYYLLIELK